MENDFKTSIISVIGTGRIQVHYKIMIIGITIHKTSETIKQSQDEVNRIVNEITTIFTENNVNRKNIHTTSIKFEPSFAWQNNSRVYTGQRVEQTLVCIIKNFSKKMNDTMRILNSITVNNNSIKMNLSFETNNKKNLEIRCRKAAYRDGYKKAKKYARLAGLRIVNAVKIFENESTSGVPKPGNINSAAAADSSILLPMGKIGMSMKLSMDFVAKKSPGLLQAFRGL